MSYRDQRLQVSFSMVFFFQMSHVKRLPKLRRLGSQHQSLRHLLHLLVKGHHQSLIIKVDRQHKRHHPLQSRHLQKPLHLILHHHLQAIQYSLKDLHCLRHHHHSNLHQQPHSHHSTTNKELIHQLLL